MPKLEVEQKKKINILLNRLIKARTENPAEYPFSLWIDVFEEKGFNYEQIIEMINYAYELPRYSTLATGDLIDNWKKITEDRMPLNWGEFNKMLRKILESDLKMLNEISNKILGIDFLSLPEREKIRELINDYEKKLESDRINKNSQAELDIINKCKEDSEIFNLKIKKKQIGILEKVLLECDNNPVMYRRIISTEINLLKQKIEWNKNPGS